MDDPDRLSFLPGTLEGLEHRVEEGIIIVRQVDPVGIVKEEFPVIGQRVLLHLEAALLGQEEGIQVQLPLLQVPQVPLVRGEPQPLITNVYALCREHGPNRSQHQAYAQYE